VDNFPNPGHPDLDLPESYPQTSLNNNFYYFFYFIGASRLIEYLVYYNQYDYTQMMHE
jgi:hypothetical protein